jgi:3-deoxy-D-manno-octulosonic-acid transferase
MLGACRPYLRFVTSTSAWAAISTDRLVSVKANEPVIIALWHGQTMLVPEVLRKEIMSLRAIVANTLVAEPLARTLKRMGIGVIRGAGPSWRGQDRDGARALRKAVKSLAEGFSVAMTADLLTCPRRCGLGIVILARLSGRPIVPVAVASSHYHTLNTPNRYTINFPFSRLSMVAGAPIFVPRNADAAELELWRERVEGALNDATSEAYAQVGAGPRQTRSETKLSARNPM